MAIDQIYIRRAGPDDATDVLTWRNAPSVRAVSLETGVIEREAHVRWYKKLLLDENRLLFIGMSGDDKAGMVRFDCGLENDWTVSVAVAPDFQGQGLGAKLLGLGVGFLRNARPVRFVDAQVKAGNTPSEKMFRSSGFVETSWSDNIINFKLKVG